MIIAGYTFVIFLYYKTASVFLFGETLSLVYCAIMCLITCFILVGTGLMFQPHVQKQNAKFMVTLTDQSKSKRDLEAATNAFLFIAFAPAIVVASTANILLGWILVHGFSVSFAKAVFRRNFGLDDPTNLIFFAGLMSVPTFVFFSVQVWRVYLKLARFQADLPNGHGSETRPK